MLKEHSLRPNATKACCRGWEEDKCVTWAVIGTMKKSHLESRAMAQGTLVCYTLLSFVHFHPPWSQSHGQVRQQGGSQLCAEANSGTFPALRNLRGSARDDGCAVAHGMGSLGSTGTEIQNHQVSGRLKAGVRRLNAVATA